MREIDLFVCFLEISFGIWRRPLPAGCQCHACYWHEVRLCLALAHICAICHHAFKLALFDCDAAFPFHWINSSCCPTTPRGHRCRRKTWNTLGSSLTVCADRSGRSNRLDRDRCRRALCLHPSLPRHIPQSGRMGRFNRKGGGGGLSYWARGNSGREVALWGIGGGGGGWSSSVQLTTKMCGIFTCWITLCVPGGLWRYWNPLSHGEAVFLFFPTLGIHLKGGGGSSECVGGEGNIVLYGSAREVFF